MPSPWIMREYRETHREETQEKRTMVDDIIAYENGELSERETIDLFGTLIANGSAWSLQGHYGRMAHSLIANGFIGTDGTVLSYPEE